MSTPNRESSYHYALQQAYHALKRGERRAARRWAARAAALAPEKEEPWLIVAALATPRASLEYLKHALEINPQSQPARKGMHWAIHRYRAESAAQKKPRPLVRMAPQAPPQRRVILYPWLIVILAIFAGAIIWFGTPSFSFASAQTAQMLEFAQAWVSPPTQTATLTATIPPTLTGTTLPTQTDIPTFTPEPTQTAPPTETPHPTTTETHTPIPTATASTADEAADDPTTVTRPSGVAKGEIWIDVDLTQQKLSVYQGKNLLDSFIVSTGTWRTPTVTGQYQIYVKYPAADMAGPGYYLPSVPYVMYFYEGYGIHGTYWHNNFGTPMSHGCVNLQTDNAEWVYNKAAVGTLVNIHH